MTAQELARKLDAIAEKYAPIVTEDVARWERIKVLHKELERLGAGAELPMRPHLMLPKSVHDFRDEAFSAFQQWWDDSCPIK